MIYIIEIPHQFPPTVWSRSNKKQVMDRIAEVSARSGDTLYEESTGRDLLKMFGYDSTDEMRKDNDALIPIADQIDTHGLDTTFYRGYRDEDYTVKPVDKWESYLEWNGHDLSTQRVYMSDDEARAALADESAWRIHQGIDARRALEKELSENCE